MALTTILAAKDQRLAYQPLLVAELTWPDGSQLHLASENLDSSAYGFPYGGHDWKPRILAQNLGSIQAIADNGIVQSPQISLALADADGFLWEIYELNIGFKGAKLVLKFIFWDPGTNTFSQDEMVKFVGVCNAPTSYDDTQLTLTFTNILNLSNINLPQVPIGRRCPWIFPSTKAARIAAATDPTSPYYPCGYSADVVNGDDGTPNTGAAARGNDGFTESPNNFCTYTWEACIARLGNVGAPESTNSENTFVQIEADMKGRRTGHFGGIRYDSPLSWRGRAYISGNKDEGLNNPNTGKYNDYFPLVYGKQFVEPPVMNVNGDPNSTRFEVVLGMGKVQGDFTKADPIEMVIVNDFVVSFRPESHDKDILWWGWVNGGDRQGHVNRDALYDGKGDPYGNLQCIEIVVPKSVQDAGGIPRVRVLTRGPDLRVWQDLTSQPTYEQTDNAAWILFDLLTKCNLTEEDIDIQSFIDAAAYCAVPISYVDNLGTSQTHPRYQLGLVLRERRSAAEIVNHVLAAMKGLLAPNAGISSETQGKLQLFIKGTLADQASSAVSGTNDSDSTDSVNPGDSVREGFVAYHFDESNILRRGTERNSPTTMKLEMRSTDDTPNRIGFQFQDEDYHYATDSLVVVDTDAVARAGGREISGGIAAEGIVNFDQGKRAIQTLFAESFRGNPRSGTDNDAFGRPLNDAGGTWLLSFDTSFRAIHLRVGHVITVSWKKFGLAGQRFRVLSITPSMNFERVTIRCQWHEDDWYLDSYGQEPDPKLQAQRRHRLLRPPFGWLPDIETPWDKDPIFDPTEKSFSIAEQYEVAADGTSIAKLVCRGKLPVNKFGSAGPPYAPQGEQITTVDPTSNVPNGAYYLSLCAVDSNDLLSPNSFPIALVRTTGATGLSLANIYWLEGTSKWRLYAGTNPNKLSLQDKGNGTPDTVSINKVKKADQAMPDVMFDHLEMRYKKVWHSGLWGWAINSSDETGHPSVDGSTITLQGLSLPENWAGYRISIIGRENTQDALPLWDFEVVSNTINKLVLKDVSDLVAMGVKPGDVVVMRTKPDIISHNTIGDSKFVNSVDYYDPPIKIIGASFSTPIVVETNVAHGYENGDEVYVQKVLGNLGSNGKFSITVPATADESYNQTHFTLVGSIGDGDYQSGGEVLLVTNGLRAHEEIGRIVRIIAGTGRGQIRRITENDQTTVTVDGDWGVTPDSTSVFIIEDHLWLGTQPGTSVPNANPDAETEITFTVDNYLEQVLWVQGFALDNTGMESVESDSPGREIYVFGGPGTLTPQFDKATFNIAVVRDLQVKNDVAPHYIVRIPGTIKKPGTVVLVPASCEAKIKIPPLGADAKLDIIITKADASYTGSIFNDHSGDTTIPTVLTIPAGATDIVVVNDFKPDLRFDENDILTINVTQIGTDIAGMVLTIVLKWTIG